MKKLMTAVVSAAAMACIAEGVDSNTVGFQNYATIDDGLATVGAAFKPINAAGEWTCDSKVFDQDAVIGDVVMYLNMNIFDLDSYMFRGYDEKGDSLGWIYNSSDPDTGDPIETPVESFTLSKGSVTYFQPGDGESPVTVAGEVEDTSKSAVVTFTGSDMYEFVNPFPIDTTLGDLETFCEIGDVLMVLNLSIFDLDSYMYRGAGQGWIYNSSDPDTGDAIEEAVNDPTLIVLPAGKGGYFQPGDGGDRTWTVTL